MVFAGEGEHLHATFLEQIHPCAGVEAGWVPGFVQLAILLAVVEGHVQKRPRLPAAVPDGVDAPVNTDSKFHIAESLVSALRSVAIFGHRNFFDVGSPPQQLFGEMMLR